MRDPYKVIGVPRDAGKGEIRNAYRRKAQKVHPDKGGDATEFTELQAAYDVLGDDGKRAQYDRTGSTDKVKSAKEEAMERIVELFDDVIAHERFRGNIIETASQIISSTLTDLTARKRKLRGTLDRYRANADRISCTGERNAYRDVLQSHIERLDNNIQALDRHEEVLREVVELLKDYRDDRPTPSSRGEWDKFVPPSFIDTRV